MLATLPFDVCIAILSHMSVRNILSLSQCCKSLHDIVDDRSVWSVALEDILGVIPSSYLLHALPSMSSRELRQRAIQLVNLNNLIFDGSASGATKGRQFTWHPRLSRVEVAAGGGHIVTMLEDGTLDIYSTQNLGGHSLFTQSPPSSNGDHVVMWKSAALFLGFSEGKHIAVVSEPYDTQSSAMHDFRIYSVDFFAPSIQLLTTITKHNQFCGYDLFEHTLAIYWRSDHQDFIEMRNIKASGLGNDEVVVMALGPPLLGPYPALTVICPHMIIVSSTLRMFLYKFPLFKTICEDDEIPVISVTPLAVCSVMHVNDRKNWMWNCLCCHHSGRLSAMVDGLGQEDFLAVLPFTNQSQTDNIALQRVGLPIAFGPSRAVWWDDNELEEDESVNLKISTHFSMTDDHPGYMRMGLSRAPDHSKAHNLSLKGQLGEVEDMSWNEESGRICMVCIPSSRNDSEPRSLVVVDLPA